MIFRRFPITFRRFPKIFQHCSEGQTNVSGHSPNISEDFPKITEDCRRRPKKIRGCFDHTLTNFSAVEGTKEKCQIWYLHMWRYHIFTPEDIISFLSICYHSVYHWLLYNSLHSVNLVWYPEQVISLTFQTNIKIGYVASWDCLIVFDKREAIILEF